QPHLGDLPLSSLLLEREAGMVDSLLACAADRRDARRAGHGRELRARRDDDRLGRDLDLVSLERRMALHPVARVDLAQTTEVQGPVALRPAREESLDLRRFVD